MPDRGSPFEGEIRGHGVPHGCSGIKGQKAGQNHEQQWRADLSMFPGRKGKATGSWKIADPLVDDRHAADRCRKSPATPNGIRRFKLRGCQNVAGLWLKYGAKSLKIETS
jgi:hypothetical protein